VSIIERNEPVGQLEQFDGHGVHAATGVVRELVGRSVVASEATVTTTDPEHLIGGSTTG
jgi:hypothetical protein